MKIAASFHPVTCNILSTVDDEIDPLQLFWKKFKLSFV